MQKIISRFVFVWLVMAAVLLMPCAAWSLTVDELPFSTEKMKDPKKIDSSIEFTVQELSPTGQYLLAFVDGRNQNRFELLAHSLPDVTYADALIDAFVEHLVTTGFMRDAKNDKKDADFELEDGSAHIKGRLMELSFKPEDKSEPIHVQLFAFVSKSTVCILVGYYSMTSIEDGRKVFKSVASSFVGK